MTQEQLQTTDESSKDLQAQPEKIRLEVKSATRSYFFECDTGSPLGEIHDAIMQLKSYIINQMAEIHNKECPQEGENQDG